MKYYQTKYSVWTNLQELFSLFELFKKYNSFYEKVDFLCDYWSRTNYTLNYKWCCHTLERASVSERFEKNYQKTIFVEI